MNLPRSTHHIRLLVWGTLFRSREVKRLPAFSFLALAVLLLPHASAAHKYHLSLTQIEYNPTEKSVEIVLRTFPDDLQNILSRRAGRQIQLDAAKDAAALTFAYVRDTVELRAKNGKPIKLVWVGMEPRADAVWLYVEGKMPGGLAGATLRNRFMFDLFEDQTNTVSAKFNGKISELTFKPGDTVPKPFGF